eukprot:TRINITY_DN34286_c0_g1_i1.p1 TRINITY_DN34286_c0_g1~~TRINITY_DN34286_c0_g1_i1.p1  ORF type:complete len:445 (+),score=142.00 TRINITY_DN34286_c0_g1_i1:75-1337(+)
MGPPKGASTTSEPPFTAWPASPASSGAQQRLGAGALSPSSKRTSVSFQGPEAELRTDAPPARRQSRRGTLATLAYEQAMQNQKYKLRAEEEMADITRDSEDLEGFLRRRASWKEGCSTSIQEFASKIREACSTRKAAERFLRGVGRAAKGIGEDDDAEEEEQAEEGKQQGTGALAQQLSLLKETIGDSAILQWAAKKREDDADDSDIYFDSAGTYGVVTHCLTRSVMPSVMRATKDRRDEREMLIRRFKPGARENEESSLQQLPGEGSKGVSLQSPQRKYPQLLAPIRSQSAGGTARTVWERRRAGRGRSAIAHFPRHRETVTVVKEAVDYATLLQDQREQHRSLADHDAAYHRMMAQFDRINYLNQRRLSRLLKPIGWKPPAEGEALEDIDEDDGELVRPSVAMAEQAPSDPMLAFCPD